MIGSLLLMLLLGGVIGRISGEERLCRISNRPYSLPLADFIQDSCSTCYTFVTSTQTGLPHLNSSLFQAAYPDLLNDETILESLKTARLQRLWQSCCKRAYDCCSYLHSLPSTTKGGETARCPRTWDGLLCWESASPLHKSRQTCPDLMTSCPDREAERTCTSAGTWLSEVSGNESVERTNYKACSSLPHPQRPVLLALGAYSLSLLTLVPALFIFQFFSALHCFRVVLHKNLMISLILHCVAEISFLAAFLLPALEATPSDGVDEITQNGDGCRFLRSVSVYLTVSNFMWVLCEGLLLHRQLTNTFAKESRKWIFFAIGWGIPCLPLIVFVSFRLSSDDANCWAFPSGIDWVWKIPCLLSLLVCYYVTRSFSYCGQTPTLPCRSVYLLVGPMCWDFFRKAVRAGLVLVPLFGLHSVLMMYRPLQTCTVAEEYYSYALRLVEGLQGCIVAVTYCYVNSEVRAALKRTWRNLVDKQQLGQGQANYTSAISTQTVL